MTDKLSKRLESFELTAGGLKFNPEVCFFIPQKILEEIQMLEAESDLLNGLIELGGFNLVEEKNWINGQYGKTGKWKLVDPGCGCCSFDLDTGDSPREVLQAAVAKFREEQK